MLTYTLAISRNNCLVAYTNNHSLDVPNPMSGQLLYFDEDHIINKTIEISDPDKSNIYYIVMSTGDILIHNVFTANCIAELAQAAYSLLAGKEDIHILYACQIKDKKKGLYASDAYVAIPPIEPGMIGPIENDLELVVSIRNYVRLLEALYVGEYPLDGHKVIDHRGGLQPWYPDGGIKGHKRKLLNEGYQFCDEYIVDMKKGIR